MLITIRGSMAHEPSMAAATIESGFHNVHKNHNLFGCAVIVIEKAGEKRKVGVDLDLEFPREWTDKVPTEYSDIGVLVQEVYGSVLKDPFPYFTNKQLTRAKVLENAVFNVAAQF